MYYTINWWTDERHEAGIACDEGRISNMEWWDIYKKYCRRYDNFCDFLKDAKEMLRQYIGPEDAKRYAAVLPLLETAVDKLVIGNMEFGRKA